MEPIEAVLYGVDLTGFTALTERLQRQGRRGAEELSTWMESWFSPLQDHIESLKGQVLHSGGDGLVAAFPPDLSTQHLFPLLQHTKDLFIAGKVPLSRSNRRCTVDESSPYLSPWNRKGTCTPAPPCRPWRGTWRKRHLNVPGFHGRFVSRPYVFPPPHGCPSGPTPLKKISLPASGGLRRVSLNNPGGRRVGCTVRWRGSFP